MFSCFVIIYLFVLVFVCLLVRCCFVLLLFVWLFWGGFFCVFRVGFLFGGGGV